MKEEWPRGFRPDWFTFGKNTPHRQSYNVARGLHPMGAKLGPQGTTCGTCAHHYVKAMGGRYHKCEKMRDTCGPGTDIRLKWRGCEHWEPFP